MLPSIPHSPSPAHVPGLLAVCIPVLWTSETGSWAGSTLLSSLLLLPATVTLLLLAAEVALSQGVSWEDLSGGNRPGPLQHKPWWATVAVADSEEASATLMSLEHAEEGGRGGHRDARQGSQPWIGFLGQRQLGQRHAKMGVLGQLTQAAAHLDEASDRRARLASR